MVRLAILASILVLCLIEVLADDPVPQYVSRTKVTPKDGKDIKNGYQIIQYKIKKQLKKNYQDLSPVLYIVGGRVSVDDILNQYTFFDKQFNTLGSNTTITPTVVYVEQRFFGASDTSGKTNSIDDYVDLSIENVIADHVALIRELSDELTTDSFLVAGGGHGGLIAGYVANKFATDKDLSGYNVLGWASSPPLKYIRDNSGLNGGDLQEINNQLRDLLINTGDCTQDDITKFPFFFNNIKILRSDVPAHVTIRDALNLDPKPRLAAGTANVHRDLKELAIYIRNSIIGLTFNNNPYNLNTGRYVDRKLKLLCNAIKQISTTESPIPAAKINAVLAVFDSRTPINNWKLKKSDNTFEKSLAAAYYQDCTQYRLVYCPRDAITPGDALTNKPDPLAGSQWDTTKTCTTLGEYDAVINEECKGLFELTSFDSTAAAYKNTQPHSFTNRVITTINTDSIFGKSFNRFSSDAPDTTKYTTNFQLWGVDNWEFQSPHLCDTAKAKDVRYLVLRAFGCLSGFVDDYYTKVCDKDMFDDTKNNQNKPYDDTKPTMECDVDNNDSAKFPFGHQSVDIVNPIDPLAHTSPPTTIITPPATQPGVTQPPKPSGTSPDNGAGSLFPMACILFSSLFLWAGAML